LNKVRDKRSDDRGSVADKGWEFFCFPPCPDQLGDPPSSLLSAGYRELFPWG